MSALLQREESQKTEEEEAVLGDTVLGDTALGGDALGGDALGDAALGDVLSVEGYDFSVRSLVWPAAFVARPSGEDRGKFSFLSSEYGSVDPENSAALAALINLKDRYRRYEQAELALPPALEDGLEGVNYAMVNAPPFGFFSDGHRPWLWVASSLEGALWQARSDLGDFLRRTSEEALCLLLRVERLVLRARVADLSDLSCHAALYDLEQPESAKQAGNREAEIMRCKIAVAALEQGLEGLLLAGGAGPRLLLLRARAVQRSSYERLIRLVWDGREFSALFDYRGGFWRDLPALSGPVAAKKA